MRTNGSRAPSLIWRIFATNAALLVAAFLLLALSPLQVKSPLAEGGLISLAGLLAMLVANLVLMRREFAPLARLRQLMRRVDPLRPGQRLPTYGNSAEVVELTEAFNEMLDRLEGERRESARRALAAQEAERRLLTRELHDGVGQRLTALMLQLDYAAKRLPNGFGGAIADAREETRATLEDVRRMARRLRPEALDDLGLRSALTALADQVSAQTGVAVERRLEEPGALDPEAELVIYRVAQESLTNVVRHSGATLAQLELVRMDTGVRLRVGDNGAGIGEAPEGSGITGMRERAVLIGAHLEVRPGRPRGTDVVLEVNGR